MSIASSGPVLIGIDWGSSNLRVALLDADGRLLDRRESAAGVFAIRDGSFAAALGALCGDWVNTHRVPLLACGMIGSRQGVVEAPYLSCPTGASDLAAALAQVRLQLPGEGRDEASATLFIIPGLKTGSHDAGWDVIRGEETQLLGAAAQPGSLFILPGTHSKWMLRSADGRIESFQTYLTGELFDLLCTHSTLARVMAPPSWSPRVFARGVDEARDGSLENLLFRVRTAGLMARFDADALPDYLSGLLIGSEVKAGLQRFRAPADQPIVVIGDDRLTTRYAAAIEAFGHTVTGRSGDAVFDGLLTIARAAGLVQPSMSPT